MGTYISGNYVLRVDVMIKNIGCLHINFVTPKHGLDFIKRLVHSKWLSNYEDDIKDLTDTPLNFSHIVLDVHVDEFSGRRLI